MAATPVHVPFSSKDEYNPTRVCKPLGAARTHFSWDSYQTDTLTKKYEQHVTEYGKKFFGVPFYFTARDELSSSDTVHSHWYDRRPTPGLDQHFIDQMMLVRRDYFLHKNCAQDWMPKVYTTKTFKTMLNEFQSAVQANEQGEADSTSRRKFYYWSDHDTGV